jgi:LacI family transcriptional regulator
MNDDDNLARKRFRGTVREVARAAGVSPSTVSNVLNNPDRVTPQTRRRVEAALDHVGYVRNHAARQLRGAPSTVIGCLLLDISNLFFAELTRGIQDRLAQTDSALMLFSTDVDADREARHVHVLQEVGVRGVIANPVAWPAGPLLDLPARGTPLVLVDCRRAGAPVCAVAADNVLGGRLAVRQLLEAGHRRFAFVREPQDVPSTAERAAGVRQELHAWGLAPDAAVTHVRLSDKLRPVETADDAVNRLLALRPAPTAVLCFNDMAAIGVLRALARRDIAVPGQVSVVGYDDLTFAGELSPPLSTVRQPAYDLGRIAAELILAEGESGHRHREVLLPPQAVQRRSIAPPRDDS